VTFIHATSPKKVAATSSSESAMFRPQPKKLHACREIGRFLSADKIRPRKIIGRCRPIFLVRVSSALGCNNCHTAENTGAENAGVRAHFIGASNNARAAATELRPTMKRDSSDDLLSVYAVYSVLYNRPRVYTLTTKTESVRPS